MDRMLNKTMVLVTLSVIIASHCLFTVHAVCPDSYNRLEKGELIKLDREVSEFYKEKYELLDRKNVSYDEQLFKSIRASRHTIVINYHDFKYTDLETMRHSEGSRVDDSLCLEHLGALMNIARVAKSKFGSVPLSAIDFLESSGRAESGVLNGNFFWRGSEASCERAKIPYELKQTYLNTSRQLNNGLGNEPIKGRYCVIHLRAKSWPKWDKYFEDRINIKMGLCVPETCHSAIYLENSAVRSDIDFLARHNLLPPFNGERYETSHLYCLPDEDSPQRQWNFATKLLIAFVTAWLTFTIYANFKYQQRVQLVRKLRESVDIRMIISQKRESANNDDDLTDSDEDSGRRPTQAGSDLKEKQNGIKALESTVGGKSTPDTARKSPQTLSLPEASASAASSVNPSPLPSEAEDNDGDFVGIRPIVVKQSDRKTSKAEVSTTGPDFIKAFSLESNINYLFKQRTSEMEARESSSNDADQQVAAGRVRRKQHRQTSNQKRPSQQLSAVNRRASSSNEALLKDLQQRDGDQGVENKSFKVAIVSSTSTNDELAHAAIGKKKKRVNMDILDGIKVIATAWIIYGHTMMFFFGLVKDLRFADERMFDFTIITLLNTLQIVSMFYIMTGALVTYLAFSKNGGNDVLKPSFWVLAIVGRYLRLMPAYMLVFWFARYAAPLTGSGSNWSDYRTDDQHPRYFCSNEPWSVMLTFSAADIKIPLDCVPQAWYLSNDFRTLLILPIYVIILAKNRIAGYVAILATFVFSALKLTFILRAANIDYEVLLHWTPQVYAILADRLHDVYTDVAVRLSTYLFGVLVGYLLYLYDSHQITKWPNWFVAIGLKLALLCASCFFMGALIISNPTINQFLPAANQVDSDLAVVLIPLFKTAMEVCMSIGILLLLTGSGYSWITELLSSTVIKVLSNISYGVFLVHIEMMYKMPLVEIESNYWLLFIHTTWFIVLSNIVAFFIYLLYEMPINNMLRYVFQKAYKAFILKRR